MEGGAMKALRKEATFIRGRVSAQGITSALSLSMYYLRYATKEGPGPLQNNCSEAYLPVRQIPDFPIFQLVEAGRRCFQ